MPETEVDTDIPEGFELVPEDELPPGIRTRPTLVTQEKIDTDIPAGFELVPEDELPGDLETRIPVRLRKEAEDDKPTGVISKVADLFTGESRTTPELEALPSMLKSPELSALSGAAFKSSIGLLLTGDKESSKGILKKQFGDIVSFTEDAKNNTMVHFPSGKYALNKPGLSPQDITRFGFEMGAFSLPSKIAGIVKSAAASSATEGLLEALEASLGGDFDINDVIETGILTGFFKGAQDLIGAGYRAVKGKFASNVVEKGKQAGIPVLTSDTLENATGIRKLVNESLEKIPFTGTGGLRAKQQIKRQAAVQDVAERYGQFSYEAIIDSLTTQKKKIKKLAGNVLGVTGKKLDRFGLIPMKNTNKAIDDAIKHFTRPGVIVSDEGTRDLNTLINAVEGAPQSFTTLTENKTIFNEILKGFDKPARTQMPSGSKAFLTAIHIGMKEDLTNMARKRLNPKEFNKWNRANNVYFQEARKLTKTRLKNVLDKGDVTPESVQTMLFSQKESELLLLFNSLTTKGKQNARGALINGVVDRLNRRKDDITPNSFATEMKKIGLPFNQFFRREEGRQLKGLLDVLNSTRRAQDAAVTTPTGQTLLVPGAGGLLAQGGLPGAATAITATLGIGVLGRVYESAPVRNALIRLGNTKKGTTAFEKSLNEAIEAITVASQAAREQIE